METRSVWQALQRRWWIPLLLTAAAVAVAGVLALGSPGYAATASVVAMEPGSSNGQTLGFPDVATSANVAAKALRDTGINESAQALVGNVSVTTTRSNLYKITVAYSTPDGAAALANAVGVEAARLYQTLAGAQSNPPITGLEPDLQKARDRYLTASQALLTFESAHPETVKGTGVPGIQAQRQQLLLDQQAAQASYLDLLSATTTERIDELNASRQFAATLVDQGVAKSQTFSNLLKIGFAGGLGLILGLALVVALEYARKPIRPMAAEMEPRRRSNGSRDLVAAGSDSTKAVRRS